MSDAPQTCRTFIAVPLPTQCLAKVVELQTRLDSRLSSRALKWTRREQLHLTLCFLGEVPTARLDELSGTLQLACAAEPAPLTLNLGSIGGFPTLNKPNVIWLGLEGDVDRLSALQARIAHASTGFGEHDEKGRAYHPHLTLARVKPAPIRELQRIGESLKKLQAEPCGSFRVEHAELIRSELTPRGSRYTSIASLKLQRPG